MSNLPILPTTLVGSYPQPDWLVNKKMLLSQNVPRVRRREIWKPELDVLDEAQNDATLIAIRDMERAGIDIVTDGEMRRESYSNRFGNALEGIDIDNPLKVMRPNGKIAFHPRIVAPIKRLAAVEIEDAAFLVANTDRHTKITLPGPFTLGQQCHDDHYGDRETLTMAFATALNEEIRELVATGINIIQLDEPWLRNNPEEARQFAVKAINRAFEGIEGVTKALHLCFGYAHLIGDDKPTGYSFLAELADTTVDQISIEAAQPKLDLGILKDLGNKTIMLGVIDLNDPEAESEELIADRIRKGLEMLPAERLVLAPDCGMKYLPRALAYQKLQSMVRAAAIVRGELG